MKKAMLLLMVLLFVLAGCYEEERYKFKYAIDLDSIITADITYKTESGKQTLEFSGNSWESESIHITNELFYFYIKLDSHETTGKFYVIIDEEVYDYSVIVTDTRINNVFSGYIDMDHDETTGVDIEVD